MANILVTGGAGFVGSHTCKRLHQAGHKPIVLDDLRAGHRWAVRWGPLVEGNVGDIALLREVFSKYKIEAVIHFAATSNIPDAEQEPISCLMNNVGAGLTLLKVMEENDVRAIVFSSSCAVYGSISTIPINENHYKGPISVYGASKDIYEHVLTWSGIRFAALRYFNAAGADPENEIGESHKPETHVIPRALEAAMNGSIFNVFGTDHSTPDGTAIRDFIHVCDLADAHIYALELIMNGSPSIALNLGSGVGHSVREITSQVERTTGRKLSVIDAPKRAKDSAVLVADAQLAHKLLNWTPSKSGLDNIVETAWQWMQK